MVRVSRANIVSWIETGLNSIPGAIPKGWDVKDIDIWTLMSDIESKAKVQNADVFNITLQLEKSEVNTITNGEGTKKL